MKIEIATTDYITTRIAVEGGADRIELCAALSEGGTTPGYGMIKECREKFSVELFPIIRPRSGDFLYTEEEFNIMKNDVKLCREMGCDGIVIGMLLPDGKLDIKRMEQLIRTAYPMEVTCHRAFDRCADPVESLKQLISIGCQRILTSGQQPTAVQGIEMIAQLVQEAGEQIIIMPGSGVRKENIKELAKKTGATEFHTSLRGRTRSKMKFMHPAFADSEESFSNPFINQEDIIALRKELEQI